jgi:hypothetical protein
MTWLDVLLKYWAHLSEEVQEKVHEYYRRRSAARRHDGPLLPEQVQTLVQELRTEARKLGVGDGKGVQMSWFDFLIARWEMLPEDLHQQLKAYDQLERAARVQVHRSLIIKIQPLETALKKVARLYGWKGEAQ